MLENPKTLEPLVRFCKDSLKNNICKDNFMDIVKVADVIADKDLLQATAHFTALNIGTFEKDEEIMNFMKSNPECFAKYQVPEKQRCICSLYRWKIIHSLDNILPGRASYDNF